MPTFYERFFSTVASPLSYDHPAHHVRKWLEENGYRHALHKKTKEGHFKSYHHSHSLKKFLPKLHEHLVAHGFTKSHWPFLYWAHPSHNTTVLLNPKASGGHYVHLEHE